MAHCRLLFVGGRANLDKIFDNAPDSSSESAAEMTIGADWVADYDWLSEKEKMIGRTTDDFTKKDEELYQEILNGWYAYCFDVRDVERYGDFCCLNCPDYEPYRGAKHECGREERNRKRELEALKQLPDDTLFHFADSHW